MRKAFVFVILLLIGNHLCLAQIHKGVLNIIEFPQDEAIPLNGEWKFFPEKLLEPKEIDGSTSGKPIYLNVPGIWNSSGISGRSYGTYSIKIYNIPVGQMLAISMPNVYSSFKLYINDKLITQNGEVGSSEDSYAPQWKINAVSFIPQHPVMQITIQVANFDHYRGGIHKEISLGTYDTIQRAKENNLLANMLLFSGLMVLGVFCLMMFFIQYDRNRINILFFALLCIAWAVRSFFAHIYLRTVFIPDFDWALSVRIEYLFLYFALVLGNSFIKSSFKLKDGLLFYLITIINFLMIAITIIFEPVVFTSLLTVYQVIAIMNLMYLIYMIIVAVNSEMKEAWFSGISVMLGISIFLMELLAYGFQWPINHIFLNSAYLLVFMLNSLVLAYQSTVSDKKLDEIEKNQLAMFQ